MAESLSAPARSLTREELNHLGRFNAERARGLVHTEEYSEKMARLQHIFDISPHFVVYPRRPRHGARYNIAGVRVSRRVFWWWQRRRYGWTGE